MDQMPKLVDLIDKPLEGFRVQYLTEVYRTDEDGRVTTSLGYLKDDSVARAFAAIQPDAAYHRTTQVFVLTDGKVGFNLGPSATLLNNEEVERRVKEAALAKLSPEDRRILKL
jgi:hypothetical protein